MFTLHFSSQFSTSFSKIKNTTTQKQIWKKVLQLEHRAPIGKKLRGNSYWSMHINKFRVIYHLKGKNVYIADILERKNQYREL